MHTRSALAGAAGAVLVGAGVFFAAASSNADEVEPAAAIEPVGHYSTVESQDPIPYVPEPVVVAVPEPEPVPVPVEPQPAEEPPVTPKPSTPPTFVVSPPDEQAPYGRAPSGLPLPAPAPDGNTSETDGVPVPSPEPVAP